MLAGDYLRNLLITTRPFRQLRRREEIITTAIANEGPKTSFFLLFKSNLTKLSLE